MHRLTWNRTHKHKQLNGLIPSVDTRHPICLNTRPPSPRVGGSSSTCGHTCPCHRWDASRLSWCRRWTESKQTPRGLWSHIDGVQPITSRLSGRFGPEQDRSITLSLSLPNGVNISEFVFSQAKRSQLGTGFVNFDFLQYRLFSSWFKLSLPNCIYCSSFQEITRITFVPVYNTRVSLKVNGFYMSKQSLKVSWVQADHNLLPPLC